MKTFELQSTLKVATVTWNSRSIMLHHATRVFVEVNFDKAEIGICEPNKRYVKLAEIELNKGFEEASLKDANKIFAFVNQHNSALVDGYDLDGLAATLEELLRKAGLIDVE